MPKPAILKPTISAIIQAIIVPAPQSAERAVQAICQDAKFDERLPAYLRRFADGCAFLSTALKDEAAEVELALSEMQSAVNGD